MSMWWQRMREEMSRQGVSQAELARRTGLSPKLIQHYCEGGVENPRGDTRAKIAQALSVDLLWLLHGQNNGRLAQSTFGGNMTETLRQARGVRGRDVPVLGSELTHAGEKLRIIGKTVEYAERPPGIATAVDAYAIYVATDDMAPRYHPGELVYVCPSRPVRAGDYVLVCLNDDSAAVRRLVEATDATLTLERHNPHGQERISRSTVTSVHRILTTNDLAGL